MPNTAIDIIPSDDGGKPDVIAGVKPASGNQGGVSDDKIIDLRAGGEDYERPSASSFDTNSPVGGGAGFSGSRIDGRTREGRAARGRPTKTQEGKPPVIEAPKISLENVLYNLHETAAALLSVKELELDREEAKEFALAIQEVGKYHAIAFDPKKVAYANLALVACHIYGTRFTAYKLRKELLPDEPKPAKTEQPRPQLVKDQPARQSPAMKAPSELWFEPAGSD